MKAHDSAYAVIMTWGKFKGSSLGDVYDTNKWYLEWASGQHEFPGVWPEACARVCLGEDISDLDLPRANSVHKPEEAVFFAAMKDKPLIKLINNKTASISFKYNPMAVAKIKNSVDSRKWNPKNKTWEVSIIELPKIIKAFGGATHVDCDDKVKKVVIEEMNRRKDLDEIRKLEDTDIKIPGLLIPPYNYQKVGVAFVERAGGRALIADEVGLGKAQPLDEKILTPDGWRTMGSLSIGEYVIGKDGLPHKITGIFPQGVKEIVKITFSDESLTRCCFDHLWQVQNNSERFRKSDYKIKSVKEILELGLFTHNGTRRKFSIPITEPIKFTKKNLPISPYVMGVLLGDGSFRSSNILVTSVDDEIIESVRVEFPSLKNASKISYRILCRDKCHDFIHEMGLSKKYSHEKFIPELYKLSDSTDRLEILRGLMDTDGWVDKGKRNGRHVGFCSTSLQLANDVKFLVQSLGGTCRMNSKIPTFTYKGLKKLGKRAYNLTISLPEDIVPFKLSRKVKIYSERTYKYGPYRSIKSIEPAGTSECQCISVEGGLYLTSDCIVTHNTFQAIAYAMRNKRKTIIVCPNSVKINWAREVLHFTGKESCIWDTKGATGHKNLQFHIINYDAVQKVINQLKKIDFDLLVCDEVTAIKNRKTIRAKAVLGDGRQKKKFPGIKTKDVIFLTATPVLNRPIEVFTFLNFLSKDRFPNYYAFTQRYGGWMGSPAKNLEELHDRTKDVFIRRRLNDIKSEMPAIQINNIYCELIPQEYKEYNELLKELFRGWKSSGKPTIGTMPKIQQFLISKKIPKAIEMIDAFLEAEHGVVIFCTYLDPLRQLLKHYGDQAGMIEGSMNTIKRQVVIDDVRARRKKIALISLKAGGMGIDGLQYGSDKVIFLDQSWVPADHHQAQGRVHRNGQKNPVQAFYLLCPSTIDEDMRELHIEKQRIADTIVDGNLVTVARQKGIFGEFVRRLRSKMGPSLFFEFDEVEE